MDKRNDPANGKGNVERACVEITTKEPASRLKSQQWLLFSPLSLTMVVQSGDSLAGDERGTDTEFPTVSSLQYARRCFEGGRCAGERLAAQRPLHRFRRERRQRKRRRRRRHVRTRRGRSRY